MNDHEPIITRFELEKAEKKLTEAIEVKPCKECGKKFQPKRGNQVFCSNECRYKSLSAYMRKYMIDAMRDRRIAEYALTLTKEQVEKFDYLIKSQQFLEDIPVNSGKECYVCGSQKSLVEHHIKYVPEEKIILCRKCHIFLHNSLFAKHKCRPNK